MTSATKTPAGPGRHAAQTRRRVSWVLGSSSGAFDLPSILVGVVVVGILTAGVLVSIFGVIPFAQDSSSKQDLNSLNTSEGVAKVKDELFKDTTGLKSAGYLTGGDHLSAVTDLYGSCYAGIARSDSGKMFFNSDQAPKPAELTGGATPSCATAVQVQGMITAVGGQTTGTPAVKSSALKFGLAEANGLPDVDNVSRVLGEYPGVVQTYTDFTKPFDMASISAVIAKGSTPIVTWEPFNAANGINQPDYTLAKLIDGSHDAYINSVADQLVAAGNPALSLRFAHEMNGNWYPWAEQVNGNKPGEYVEAWKHVHDLFAAKGLTNIDWVWAPNIPYTGSQDITSLYPGSAYVGHTGIDGFNFGTTDKYSSWKAPWDVFGSGLGALQYVAPDKNIYVTETASVETEGTNTKKQWIKDMVYYLDHWGDGKAIKIQGFVWFDQVKYDQLSLGQTTATNWRIDSSPDSIQGMEDALGARR